MRCPSCKSENPVAIKFCGNCGRPLSNRCAKCGAENPPQFRFCGGCGTALNEAPTTTGAEIPVTASMERDAERRHLTVLFCDLVGSTEIAARLDPEEWRETVSAYHHAAAQAIEHFGGHVAKYLGDGVMAFFGYPEAHENDAERAVRAGLAILEAVGKFNQEPARLQLSARVGIDSGAVVVGVGAGKEADVFGDAPNVAARVQSVAEPGTVMVTEATQRLVAGLFVVEDRGAHPLKGVDRQGRLYRIVQPSGMRGRLEAAAARGLTPFVGREDELRLLMNRWEGVREGEGQVVTIIGEAGIGKSRLVQRFREEIASDSHTWLECATAPFFQNTPFYAVAEILRQSLQWDQRFAALEASLGAAAISSDAAPITPPAKVPDAANRLASTITPEEERKRLLATLVGWTLETTRNQPLVITTEDLHWADPSTLELIQLLVEQGATSRLLLLYTARPEFRAQWPLRAHHTQITLNRLSAHNVRAMIAQVASSKALAGETVDAVIERTGGVPLFVEELTRAVLEGGANLAGRAIPATLHDSLMARLDRLGAAKEIAQIGAVIGNEFSYELLGAVHPIAEADLERRLQALADAELIYVRGIAPNATYQFKHALIRDAAYEALLKSRRKELHRLVAQVIDEKFSTIKETQPEVLARHWTEAGDIERAIAEWQRAGERAAARSAMDEVGNQLSIALELLSQLAESPERDSRELDLRQAMLVALRLSKGYAAPETITATERVAVVAEKTGDIRKLSQSAGAQFLAAVHIGDLSRARQFADKALETALGAGSTSLVASAHGFEVIARHHCGDFAGTERSFTAWLEVQGDQEYGRLIEAKIATFAIASRNAWMLGRADTARERQACMMNAAAEGNPYRTALSSCRAAQLQVLLRDYSLVDKLARRAAALVEEFDFRHLRPTAYCILGRARGELGQFAEGIGSPGNSGSG